MERKLGKRCHGFVVDGWTFSLKCDSDNGKSKIVVSPTPCRLFDVSLVRRQLALNEGAFAHVAMEKY